MKVWQGPKNLTAINRSSAGHSQIVCAVIMHHKGNNNYLKEKGGLYFGIRRTFVRNEQGDGIIPVTLASETKRETMLGTGEYNTRIEIQQPINYRFGTCKSQQTSLTHFIGCVVLLKASIVAMHSTCFVDFSNGSNAHNL